MPNILPEHLPELVRRPRQSRRIARAARSFKTPDANADVCLILEGTYPYVAGGVSSWVHDLVTSLRDLRFALVCLAATREHRERRYDVPDNVVSITDVPLQYMPHGRLSLPAGRAFFEELGASLTAILSGGGLPEIQALTGLFERNRERLGEHILVHSPQAWSLMQAMYAHGHASAPFLEYFWTWRGLFGPLFSVLMAPLPACRVYHTISTGYAGVMAARAAIETRRPAIVTEHGIYTNERRIEITLADWIYESERHSFSVEAEAPSLKDMWRETFLSYSRACYDACASIYTIYSGNQRLQLADGASPRKMRVIPNGVDIARFENIKRSADNARPTIALIGRVVSIKDVKTFIRACGLLQRQILDLQAWIMGPTEEEPGYYEDCMALVRQEGLGSVVTFTGQVNLTEYLPHIDVVVLTSVSEGQPLVLLEAGAAGIPCVATDVGACREILYGSEREDPKLGAGGMVTTLASPAATAEGIRRLLVDRDFYERCSATLRERTRLYYSKEDMVEAYRRVYREHMAAPGAGARQAA